MKLIKMIENGKVKSSKILRDVMANSPVKALTIDDIEKRVRLMKVIEKSKGADLILEDADAAYLLSACDNFPWAQADEDLLQVLLAVKNAEKAPEGMTPPNVE